MDLNGEGLLRVAPEDGAAATKKAVENARRTAFDEWPNEAGVSIIPLLYITSLTCPCYSMPIYNFIITPHMTPSARFLSSHKLFPQLSLR